MPVRTEPILKDNFYHIYNRGVNKGTVIFTNRNYEYFLFKMRDYSRDKANVLAYCLMPNHYHLLVKIESEIFVKSAMQPFFGAFTKAINEDQKRVGPLFQGRYQANLICDDIQLLDCVKYIHLNPVKARIVQTPAQWEFSSYRDYLSVGNYSFIETRFVLRYFPEVSEFIQFTEFGIDKYESRFFKEKE